MVTQFPAGCIHVCVGNTIRRLSPKQYRKPMDLLTPTSLSRPCGPRCRPEAGAPIPSADRLALRVGALPVKPLQPLGERAA